MTLREYLMSEVEYAKSMMIGNYDTEELNHYEGYKEAMEAVLEQLPKLEHESDVERISDECKKAENCRKCPLCDEDGACVIYDEYPNYWDLDDIKRRLEEARNDT